MKNGRWARSMVFGVVLAFAAGMAYAQPISINEIQSNMVVGGDASTYAGGTHDVAGGVVTRIVPGFAARVYIQDPTYSTYGAIVVKDQTVGYDLANNVSIGDWVSFTDIPIEESNGTTQLYYNPAGTGPGYAAFSVASTGNPVPDVPVLTPADLSINPTNHAVSEGYESMIVSMEDVTVGLRDLGRKEDNYELLKGDDTAWGADWQNIDVVGDYHPYIYPGAELSSITGVVEQVTKSGWDYYQLATGSTADIVPEPGTLVLLIGGVALISRRRR